MIDKGKLTKIVGAGNVTYEQAALDEYASDVSFVNRVRPACVVKPRKAGEVKKIIQLANKTGTPLVPVSSGGPHFRGDTVPTLGDSIVVDLSNLKEIAFVDRPRRVTMIEPGVTFGDLISAAKKEGLRLNLPLLPRASKSVLASVLEREPVILPKYQWDVSDPLACLGLCFGSGDEFRTGQAAGPGTVKQQWKVGGLQKAPYGPGIGSLHRLVQGAQGTMGIVTWMSLRCELLPSVEEPFVLGSDSLEPLLELSSWLIRLRAVNECFILNDTNMASIFAKKSQKDFQRIKDAMPAWTLFYVVAGYDVLPEERVSSQVKDITDITQRMGISAAKSVGGVSANEILKAVQKPCEDPYWKTRSKGACEDIMFLSIHDKLQGQVDAMNDLADKSGYGASNVGVYIQSCVQGTSYHCEFNLFYDPENAIEFDRTKALSYSATKQLMDKGAFFSRPYGDNAQMIANRDAATVSVLHKFKKIFDPNNVMNPGKICY